MCVRCICTYICITLLRSMIVMSIVDETYIYMCIYVHIYICTITVPAEHELFIKNYTPDSVTLLLMWTISYHIW